MKLSTVLFADVKKTALNAWHKKNNGKMVEFCGWEMPVQYKEGVLKEHFYCRQSAAIFDVAHMGQLRYTGKDRLEFMEYLTPVTMKVPVGSSKLSVILNAEGCVIDDTIITRQDDHVFQIINAGCVDKDLAYIKQKLQEFNKDVQLQVLDKSLIALQGPKAAGILQSMVKVDLSKMDFMMATNMVVADKNCYVTRCGYTGEDGFEISMEHKDAEYIADILLSKGGNLAGLGCRDSLRLEAGLCLYGHELNDTISPVGAALNWLVVKARRENGGGFIGAARFLKDIKDGVSKKRVGLLIDGAPARENCKIFSEDGSKEVGITTSGGPSPCLKKNIAMAYVPTPMSKNGTKLTVEVRGKKQKSVVTSLPFVPTQYYRASK